MSIVAKKNPPQSAQTVTIGSVVTQTHPFDYFVEDLFADGKQLELDIKVDFDGILEIGLKNQKLVNAIQCLLWLAKTSGH